MENKRADISEMQATIDEHHYVITRHAKIIGETHEFSKSNAEGITQLTEEFRSHVAKEKNFEDALNQIRDDNKLVLDYVNKMEVGAWFMSKIKSIVTWLTVVAGGGWSINELVKHFHDKQ